jgi:chromosome segregation ATPase
VQPDQLRKEIRRIDVRLEELAGVDEKLERMQQTVMEEMRLMRERMEVVRGGDTLLSLNEEVKSELNSIRKLEALTSKHADSVESIYIETQKGMSEIKNLKESMDEAHREISGFTADITELRKKANAAPEKADITRLEDLLKKQDARAVSSDATLKKLEDTIATLKEKAAWLDQRVTTLSGPSAKPGEQGTNPSSDNLPKE